MKSPQPSNSEQLDELVHKVHLCLIGKYDGDPKENAKAEIATWHQKGVAAARVAELESLIKGQPVTNFTKHMQARANEIKEEEQWPQPKEPRNQSVREGKK